jgi:hypothetical protein
MKVIFFYGPIVFHARHQGYQSFTNWDDARLTTSIITYKMDFLSNEGTNLHHEVGMQFS